MEMGSRQLRLTDLKAVKYSLAPNNHPPSIAVSNDVVLRYIFGFLDVNDLLDIRLVNRQWCYVASLALRKRPVFIKGDNLCWMSGVERFSRQLPPKELKARYMEALQLIRTRLCDNASFPAQGFVIDEFFCQIEPTIAINFSKNCGKYFRLLRIQDGIGTATLLDCVSYFVMLEQLEICNKELRPRLTSSPYPKTSRNAFHLPYLKYLTLPNSDFDGNRTWLLEFFRDILKEAPRLEVVKNFSVGYGNLLQETGSLDLVSHLHIDLKVPRDSEKGFNFENEWIEDMELIARKSLKLSTLKISGMHYWLDLFPLRGSPDKKTFWTRSLKSFDGILSNSGWLSKIEADTLQNLPVLANVKKLCITPELRTCAPYRVFSASLSPRLQFPALQSVKIKCGTSCITSIYECFRSVNSDDFPLVHELELAIPLSNNLCSFFSKVFPNCRVLRSDWAFVLNGTKLSCLWQFSSMLEGLEVYNFPLERMIEFDSEITGFTSELCEKLRKMPRQQVEPDVLDIFRTSESITNLSGLNRLVIHVAVRRFSQAFFEPRTPICGFYAFDLMPNLTQKVVCYDHRHPFKKYIRKSLQFYNQIAKIEHFASMGRNND